MLILLLLLASGGAAPAPSAEPLERPIASVTLSVRQEANGQCAEVDAGLKGRPALIRMTDLCHGWSSQSCAATLLIKGQGIIEDAAQILFLRENRSADLVALIDAEIGRKWPDNEHLHLAFAGVDCGGPGMAVAFSGSRVPKGVPASAIGIKGTVTLRAPTRIEVEIVPTE